MIIVNVRFAEMNKSYDFKVDETQPIYVVTDEMVEMIAEKEHLTLARKKGTFLLCDQKQMKVLDANTTLADNQIMYGDDLFLV